MEAEAAQFDYWNDDNLLAGLEATAFFGDGSSSLPPPLMSSDQQWRPAATSQPLISNDLCGTMPGGGGDMTNGVFGHQWIHGDDGLPTEQVDGAEEDLLPFNIDDLLFDDDDVDGSSQVPVVDSEVQAAALSEQITQMGRRGAVSPPAAQPNNHAAADVDEMVSMMMTLPDMVRMAEECAKDEAASRVWSGEEHKQLLYRLDRYPKDDSAFSPCCSPFSRLFFARYAKDDGAYIKYSKWFFMASYVPKKTAKEVALRYRWLQDKGKPAKQAESVQKESAAVKLKKGQGAKGAKKNNKMYPLSKEALDSKSTRELLRDSCSFMLQIEENIKAGELDGDTADYFYFVKTNIDAIGKREKEFCRISMPMPPVDEQGLEEILQQSRHTSSAGKEAAERLDGTKCSGSREAAAGS